MARSAIHRGPDVSSTAEFGKTGCQACPQRAQIATEIEAQRRADRHVGAPLQEYLASRPKQANHPVSARVPRSSGKALESSTKTLAICAPFSLLDTNRLALGNLNDCRAGANFLIYRLIPGARLRMTRQTLKPTQKLFLVCATAY